MLGLLAAWLVDLSPAERAHAVAHLLVPVVAFFVACAVIGAAR